MVQKYFEHLYENYCKFLKWTGIIASVAFFIMMLLVSTDIFSRKFFGAPLKGTLEIVESLLTFCIFMGAAFTLLTRGHVRVTIIPDHIPAKAQHVLLVIVYAIGTAFFAVVAYNLFLFAWDSWLFRETKWGTIQYPLYPVKFFSGVGCLLLAIQFLMDFLHEIYHPTLGKEGGAHE
ncbi:MAG: hypothetical protein A2Y80_10740 [Deltaproteobacteria bacterium RBG_13_58_19]|jgi:TRAP-type C4-dicarboxylate transport system permease small subunit|nr:MAG: hypothetical protein A2Y80_10740 [Deltaproteobacteria bacterium RBG_13_58_19]